jgi:hypothetical protein
VAIVKSRSEMTGRAPAGSVTAEMWIAGRLFLVDEMHRHGDVHHGILADAQEIYVHGEVADRVELKVFRQDLDPVPVDVDRGDRRQEAAAVDLVVDVLVGQGDGQGRLLVAIDDCRHFAVAANCTGGPLTDLFARLGLELVRIVAHGISFRFHTGASAGPALALPKTSKAAGLAALRRVASKGVYAGGGSITEGRGDDKTEPKWSTSN